MRQQRNDISTILGSEHRWIDERFNEFGRGLEKGRVEAGPFREAATVLHRHIYLEEEVLFPEVEVRGLSGPTAVMAQEHGEICRRLNDVEDLIKAGAPAGRISGAFRALCSLLEEHNLKEERVLYPSADRLLGPEEGAKVSQQLRAAEPPEGWMCRAHRTEG